MPKVTKIVENETTLIANTVLVLSASIPMPEGRRVAEAGLGTPRMPPQQSQGRLPRLVVTRSTAASPRRKVASFVDGLEPPRHMTHTTEWLDPW